MNKLLIAIVGPTAIGKTSLSIKLAKHFNAEIFSADSRQFFKEMKIGTAVPEEDELNAAKHHFIQHISIEETYNVGLFEKECIQALDTYFVHNDVAILVGGSGLYVDAIINGLDKFPDVDPQIRKNLSKELETKGIEILQKELLEKDSEHYNSIDLSNKQRLIRALEICRSTSKPYSTFLAKNKIKRAFKTLKIGLNAEREVIYNRINHRVDLMIKNGLIEEAKALIPLKDLINYFDNQYDLNTAIEEIKKNTRRFAKRQLTWYRRDGSVIWFDYLTPIEEIIKTIKEKTPLE